MPPAGPRRAASPTAREPFEKGSLDPPKLFVSPAAKGGDEVVEDFAEKRE